MNRGDLTKPDADGDEERLSGSPADESRRIEEPEPSIPEVIPEPPSELEATAPEGQTRVVLLPVDPYLVHAYWRLAPQDLEKAYTLLAEYGQQPQAVLKFFDVTHIIFDGANAHTSFEVNIELGVGNWYVHLWSPGRSYCVDLGFRTEGGGFLPLARSNVAETPQARPSTRVEEHYTLVEGDLQRAERVQPSTEDKDGPLISAWNRGGQGNEYSQVQHVEAGREELTAISPITTVPDAARAAHRISPGKEQRSTGHGLAGPIDWSKIWLSRLAEIYGVRIWEKPRSKPTLHPPDLTEASEEKFVSGLSSSRGVENQEAKKASTQTR